MHLCPEGLSLHNAGFFKYSDMNQSGTVYLLTDIIIQYHTFFGLLYVNICNIYIQFKMLCQDIQSLINKLILIPQLITRITL